MEHLNDPEIMKRLAKLESAWKVGQCLAGQPNFIYGDVFDKVESMFQMSKLKEI